MPFSDPEKRREYQREWIARNRAEWFAGKSCITCGSEEKLQVHHRDPVAKVDHRVFSWSRERRARELAKCDAMCEVCHRRLHEAALRYPCGTVARYVRGKCRCDSCKAAKAAKERDYRERRRRGELKTRREARARHIRSIKELPLAS